MTETLDALRSEKYMSENDLLWAYHKILLDDESKPITALVVPGKGVYQFKLMPFSLTNAPAAFQCLMDNMITPELKLNVFCYLDEIVVTSKIFEDHLKQLQIVLDKLKDANLTIGL